MMTIASQDKRKQLERKLLDLAFEKIELSSVSALLLSTLIVVALWPIIEHQRLLVWLGTMTIIQTLILFYARRYKSARSVESELHKWRTGLVAGGVAGGLCWGSTVFGFPSTPFNPETVLGIFVLPSTPFDPVTVLLMFILAGVAAYASVAMAFVPSFAMVFLACTLLPLSVWLLSFGEHMNVTMSMISFSYFFVMVVLSRRMYATVCSLISVSEENLGLRTAQQESDWRMQQFFESAPGFFYTASMTADGKSSMPFVSAGIHELFDLASGEVAGSMSPLFALVHAEDIECIVDAREASRKNLSRFRIEFRINHRIKGERWIELHSLPQREPDGSTSWHGFMQDITGRKRMEELLAVGEREFRTLAENLPVAVIRYDAEQRRRYINPAAERMLHGSMTELLGKVPGDGGVPATPAMIEHYRGKMEDVLATGEAGELEFVLDELPSDLQECFEVRFVPEYSIDGKSCGVLAIWYDITERKRMEDRLAMRECEFRSLAESSPDFIIRYDREQRMRYLNGNLMKLLGIAVLEEVVGKHPSEVWPDGRFAAIDEAAVKAIASDEMQLIELAAPGPNGETTFSHIYVVAERDAAGEIVGTLAFGRDITAIRATQRQLELLEYAINVSSDAIYLINGESLRFDYVNDSACHALGYSRKELLTMEPSDIDPDMPREQGAEIMRNSPVGLRVSFETRHRAKDGRIFSVELNGTHFELDGKKFSLSVVRDITERKRVLRELELLGFAINQSSDAMYVQDESQYFISVNDAACRALGYSREDLLEMSSPDIDPDFTREMLAHAFATAELGKPSCFETRHRTKDGRIFPVEITGTFFEIDGARHVISMARDITERKQVELALRASEEKLSNLFALSPLGIALTDMQGCYIEFNEAFRAICAYPTDELMTLDYWTLTPKKYEAQEAEQLESLAKTGRYGPYEKEYRQKDGTLIPIQLSGVLVSGRDGGQYIWSIVEDISERRKSEAELKERFKRIAELNRHLEQNARDLEEQAVELEMSKEQLQQTEAWYRSILHSAPDGMLIVDSRGYIMQVNAQLEAMFGYEGGELPGCSIEVLLPQAARAAHVDLRNGFISSGQRDRRMAGAAQDLFGSRKDGSEFPVDVSLSRLPDLDGREGTICAAVRDVTERQKADVARESALAEALRLAQLRSTFLAQMSHELRTPLNGILGYSQNLLRGEALGENQRSGLKIIQHSGEHLLTLINGILDHAAIEADKFELIPGDIELESFLSTIISIIRVRVEQKNIAFSCDAGDDLPAIVRGDAQRLRQVLLNLLSNAVKFTDNGKVILRVTYSAPSRLRFVVQDSGVGIAAEQLDSIFQPFEQVGETSRRAGGTGLGLAISHKLVGLMGGSINVESLPGAGSVFSFEVEMPAVQSDSAKVNAAVLSEQAATRSLPLMPLLLAPPPQELDVLQGLALRGNMRDVALQATRLAELDPRYVPFAEHLRQLAKGFQTKALLGFIAQYRDEKECK
ncbi:MAG: PAS domain S-box protein [Gallionellaceae bacterium]|jgi:PAS domain S-box-containing protein